MMHIDADSAAWLRGLEAGCPKCEGYWYERCDPHGPALPVGAPDQRTEKRAAHRTDSRALR